MLEFSSIYTWVYLGIIISFLLAFLRLWLGPSLADRVVALDLISVLTIAVIATFTLESKERAFLDIAITLALISFLGTIAFAQYIRKQL
ncbi:monovalent cation/H+ antiporter complex subunit F [Fibrobacterales bacterium]|nr:monovalent cation/H+ antiporter complex subunit F [Fibrobacterales bacterium]